ncbi:copper resistance protein CopC [Solwaraspora sp. WMMD937]|uniref:copper resistance CopC family protein n=1 Tax=Solwaraspora sp. WMMD937 TaxID=3016090 RepID=UPI00249B7C9D|nr:copper resistance CopC family protein [Solwaraspora sp. WMMD937]WFE21280.1 copper resistance protein CopC [Solwaraspora sp. WMMD937]
MVRVPGTLLAVFVGMLAVLFGASPAQAHNVLTGSDPADGAELAQAPETVRLTFLASLNQEQTELSVTGPDGAAASTGAPVVDGKAVSVPFRPGPAGEYTVDYNVLSTDGHWVKGTLAFTLTVGVEPTADSSPTGAPSPTAAEPTPEVTRAPTPQATSSTESTPWWPWLVGAVVLLVAVAAGAFFVRRRST